MGHSQSFSTIWAPILSPCHLVLDAIGFEDSQRLRKGRRRLQIQPNGTRDPDVCRCSYVVNQSELTRNTCFLRAHLITVLSPPHQLVSRFDPRTCRPTVAETERCQGLNTRCDLGRHWESRLPGSERWSEFLHPRDDLATHLISGTTCIPYRCVHTGKLSRQPH